MNLFQRGDFTLHSGAKSKWKVECDALTDEDWEGLAAIAVERMPKFSTAIGVPRGGLPFARALDKYRDASVDRVLIAEDVTTTGSSMEAIRMKVATELPDKEIVGVVAFCRGRCPDWVTPLWVLPSPQENRVDWRVGLSVKPKSRSHRFYYEEGVVVHVHPDGTAGISCKNGILVIKMSGGCVVMEPADEWRIA